MAEFGEILKQLREARGFSQEKLAAEAGLSRMTIARAEQLASSTLQGTTYAKLARALGMSVDQLDRAWRGGVVPRQQSPGIPLISKASAGVGRDFSDMGFDQGVGAFDDSYLPRSLYPGDENAFAFYIEGDSMVPELREGDVVIASPKAVDDGEVADGEMVFVRFTGDRDDGCTVKRVYDLGDAVDLVAENRAYKPMRVPKEHIARLAKVVVRITNYA